MFWASEFHSRASPDLQGFEGSHIVWPGSKQLQSPHTHQMLCNCIHQNHKTYQICENMPQKIRWFNYFLEKSQVGVLKNPSFEEIWDRNLKFFGNVLICRKHNWRLEIFKWQIVWKTFYELMLTFCIVGWLDQMTYFMKDKVNFLRCWFDGSDDTFLLTFFSSHFFLVM